MRAEDRRHTLSFDGAQNRIDMARAIRVGRIADAHPRSGRAGVDDRHIAPGANDPCLGSGEGIGGRIGREHAAHQRLMLFAVAGADRVGPRFFFAPPSHVASPMPKEKPTPVKRTAKGGRRKEAGTTALPFPAPAADPNRGAKTGVKADPVTGPFRLLRWRDPYRRSPWRAFRRTSRCGCRRPAGRAPF